MKLLEKLKGLLKSTPKEVLDPSKFNDELAMKTQWTPLVPGGASFRTRKLVISKMGNKANFKTTIGALLFGGIFFIVGLGVLIFGIIRFVSNGVAGESFFLTGFGLIFGAVGAGMLCWFTRPIVFDQDMGFFWKGRVSRDKLMYSVESLKNCVSLKKIHALQIISEFCKGDKSSYYSYELNLVLDDGERLNVVDHGDLKALRADAEILSEYLQLPVWDGVLR